MLQPASEPALTMGRETRDCSCASTSRRREGVVASSVDGCPNACLARGRRTEAFGGSRVKVERRGFETGRLGGLGRTLLPVAGPVVIHRCRSESAVAC